MKVVISGASGLVGQAAMRFLGGQGHEVLRLVRRTAGPGEISWDPTRRTIDRARLEDVDAVLHLAGDNIATGRWTKAKKQRIRESRVAGTALLAEALIGLQRPPRVLISASAVGYYGHRGDDVLDESSPPGTGFLAGVCRDWEAATQPAAATGLRVVHLRLGVVLSGAGGTLARLLPLFRWGLGGVLGSGRQWMSWITAADLLRIIGRALSDESMAGPINAVAPQPVTNRQFTQILARVLHRPAVLPAPALALRLLLGEMADELLLASTRVLPRRLQSSSYTFADAELEPALRRTLAGSRGIGPP